MMVEAFAQIDHEEMTPFSASQQKPPDHDLRPPDKLHHLDGRDLKARRDILEAATSDHLSYGEVEEDTHD